MILPAPDLWELSVYSVTPALTDFSATSIKPPEQVRLQTYFLVGHIVFNTSTQYNVDDPTRTQEQTSSLSRKCPLPVW